MEMNSLHNEILQVTSSVEKQPQKAGKRKLINTFGYILGNTIVIITVCMIIPKMISNVSGKLYKASVKRTNKTNSDDWGPVIIRKERQGNNCGNRH